MVEKVQVLLLQLYIRVMTWELKLETWEILEGVDTWELRNLEPRKMKLSW